MARRMTIQASPIAEALRALIREKGRTISDVVSEADVPAGTISSWMSGRTNVDPLKPLHMEYLTRLCQALGVTVDDLKARAGQDRAEAPVGAHELHLAPLLLDTLQDPNASVVNKRAARTTIERWLKAMEEANR